MAALLGGIGSPFGAFISALLVGIFSSLSDYYLAAQWTPVLLLALLVLLFVWKPTGVGSDDAGTESTSVRDSIILTAPARRSHVMRWLFILINRLAIVPLFVHRGDVIVRLSRIY